VPENNALDSPLVAAAEVGWGARMLSGGPLVWAGAGGGALALGFGLLIRRRADALLALSLLAMAALPWAGFVKGHPFRIRYMVPLLAIEAVGAGVAVGFVPRLRIAIGLLVLGAIAYGLHPFNFNAGGWVESTVPMIVEAEWEQPNAPVRK